MAHTIIAHVSCILYTKFGIQSLVYKNCPDQLQVASIIKVLYMQGHQQHLSALGMIMRLVLVPKLLIAVEMGCEGPKLKADPSLLAPKMNLQGHEGFPA